VERDVVDKQFMVKPSDSGIGIVEVPVPTNLRREPSLEAMQIDALVRTALDLELRFDAPQDIEWTFDNGDFWLLQTRPITAVPNPFPVEWERESDRTIVWTRGAGITERLVDPVTPMSFSLFQRMVITGWDAAMRRLPLPMLEGEAELRLFNHYLYWNVDITAKPKLTKVVPFGIKLLSTLFRGVDLWNERLPKYLSAVQTLEGFDLHTADLLQLMAHLDAACNLFADSFVWEVHLGTTLEIFGDLFLDLIPRVAGCTTQDAALLLQGWGNLSLDMERRMWQLAEAIWESPELSEVFEKDLDEHTIGQLQQMDRGRAWLAHFQKFLDDYGHHSAKDDWFFPNWRQSPFLVLRILQAKLRLPVQHFDAVLARRSRERRERANLIRDRLKRQPIRKAFFDMFLSMAQRWIPLKEDRQYYIKLTCNQLRLTLHEVGKRLRDLEVLLGEDDVFFLSLEELGNAIEQVSSGKRIDLRELAKMRRREWRTSFGLSPPPRIKGDLVEGFATEHPGSRRVLQGNPASPGVATGVARVIWTPDEFGSFLPGEILVTQATNPCWVPLFGQAKAVVTNYGGSLCHCAMLAREMGIPAVVGTAFATGVIRTGSTITVDGARGIVLVE